MEKMIEANSISMGFDMDTNRVTSLKEWVLTWLRGKRSIQTFWALDDVSFDVYKGEVVGIIGRNGSGKSTLLKIISGLFPPTKGSVRVHGRIIPMLELGSGFDPELTGRENVFLNGAILGYSEAFLRERFDEIRYDDAPGRLRRHHCGAGDPDRG